MVFNGDHVFLLLCVVKYKVLYVIFIKCLIPNFVSTVLNSFFEVWIGLFIYMSMYIRIVNVYIG